MKKGVVAKRYAQALADVIGEEGEVDSTLKALEELHHVVETNPELKSMVMNPAIPVGIKERVFTDVMEGMRVSSFIRELVMMAVKNNRVQHLGVIAETYRDMTDEQLNRVRVHIRSAFPLETGEEDSLRDIFGRVTGKKTILFVEIDKSLIGGIVAQIGWTVYDGSVINELRNLRTKFKTWLEEDI